MKRKFFISTLLVFVLGLAAATALAGFFPSFGGSNNNTITYTVSWKGSFDTLTIDMTGDLTPVCRNHGGNEAPGQTSVHIEQYDTSSTFVRAGGVKSHAFKFPGFPRADGTKESPDDYDFPSWQEAGCPSRQWEVSRVYGTLHGTLNAEANGRIETFSTTCYFDSAITGEMSCTISEG